MTDIAQGNEQVPWELRSFRALVAELAEFVWQSDTKGEPVGDTSGWRRFTGQSSEEITAGGWAKAVHPDDCPRVLEIVYQAIVGQVPWQTEGRLRRHDGVWRHMAARGVPVYGDDGAVHGWIGSCQDVTERKAAEAALTRLNQDLETRAAERTVALTEEMRQREDTQMALLQSQERYALIEAATNDGIWDANLLTGEFYRSPRWKGILGYADDELPNTAAIFFDLLHPDDKDAVAENLRAHLEEDKPHAMDFRLRCKNGDYLWVHGRSKATRDASGRPVRMVGTISDISERKRTAEMLAQAQKMEAIGQLTAGIAHDFNNLLAVIGGGLEFVAAAARRGLTADQELIEAALRATRRGTELVRRLLTFSRQSELSVKPMAVDQLVLDTLRLLQRTLGAQVEIKTRLDATEAVVAADRGQLVNAILNLVINARDAMPEGGRIVIATKCRPAQRSASEGLARWPTGEEVCIAVSDSGVGMSEDVRKLAFEPFFTTKKKGVGVGLGLSMVRGYVENIGGYVEFDSVFEKGTTITMCLPRIDAISQPEESEADAALIATDGKETVLLVEDDPDMRIMTAAQLKQSGYRVHAVASGMEAINVIASPAEIDIMLTDMVLPGDVDGMTLVKEAIRTRPKIGIVCMSGYTPTQGQRKWLSTQNIRVLEKPFLARQLSQALSETTAK